MKERILTGWTYTRVIYLLLGMLITVQSAMDRQWVGVAFGLYFSSMGLFAFGCAAGNCVGGSCRTDDRRPVESQGSVPKA
ncbi:MAG: hypothetical protein RLY31_1210 [Bacteroidota bacterium]